MFFVTIWWLCRRIEQRSGIKATGTESGKMLITRRQPKPMMGINVEWGWSLDRVCTLQCPTRYICRKLKKRNYCRLNVFSPWPCAAYCGTKYIYLYRRDVPVLCSVMHCVKSINGFKGHWRLPGMSDLWVSPDLASHVHCWADLRRYQEWI